MTQFRVGSFGLGMQCVVSGGFLLGIFSVWVETMLLSLVRLILRRKSIAIRFGGVR